MNDTTSSTLATMTGGAMPGFLTLNVPLILLGLVIGFFGNKILNYLWDKYVKPHINGKS